MRKFFDTLETRTHDERASDISRELPRQIANAQTYATGFNTTLADVDATAITDLAALAKLPILRKSDLSSAQSQTPPLGGFATAAPQNIHQLFQSPGPIYEMGQRGGDWWRFGRFVHAVGIGAGDIVQNTFSYHFTPAGAMFDNAAAAVGASVFAAGPGQTELQAQAAADLRVTAYAGTPDYLNTILVKADEMGLDLSAIRSAAVSGGPLFPQIRSAYTDRGIKCLQCYATADLGHIAYESDAMDGMIIDEGVIVEIVTPGTGIPVKDGEIGEVVVTTMNPDYPLIRFATGDLSSMMSGESPCGRTNKRITGWKGRADQATKVKGMFVRPEQVAQLLERHPEIIKARVEVTHDGTNDAMTVRLESLADSTDAYAASIQSVLKLRANVDICAPNSLPNDGLVIADLRDHG
jgi:phenylacetate-CoA ligase